MKWPLHERRLTVDYVEDGDDGPGWYILDRGFPIWGAYDTETDAESVREEHEKGTRVGGIRDVNGVKIWIAHIPEVNRVHRECGYLVMVDDEDVGDFHPSRAAAEVSLHKVIEEICRYPEDWAAPSTLSIATVRVAETPTLERRPAKKMAPTAPPGHANRERRRSGTHP
ncbi:MAG: hypothetical protein K2R98_26280 [Gemmataceae bacterium]|nr:hypothetical protein [Gemmataceae bacterium]